MEKLNLNSTVKDLKEKNTHSQKKFEHNGNFFLYIFEKKQTIPIP